MPISSGAAGRSGAEHNTYGSYLKTYLGTLPQEKRMILENTLEAECISATAGEKNAVPLRGIQEDQDSVQRPQSDEGDKLKPTPSKKSSTCTLF